MTREEIDEVATAAVHKTLLTIGVDVSNPESILAVQADFQHLRAWRESTEAVKRKALLTAVGIIITGAIGYLGVLFMRST